MLLRGIRVEFVGKFFAFVMLVAALCAGAPAQSTQQLPDAPSATAQVQPVADAQGKSTVKAERPGGFKNNFKDFVGDTLSPATILGPAFGAGMTMTGSSSKVSFGTGAEAYGYIFGLKVADSANGRFIREFLLPTVTNQLHRYQRFGKDHKVNARIGHAFAHQFVTKTRNGTTTFNMSSIPGSWAVAGVGNFYYPDQKTTVWATTQRAAWTQVGYLSSDLFKEFAPEFCHALRLPCGK